MSGPIGPRRVHVAFVGWDVQRVTEPAIQGGADLLYLIRGGSDPEADQCWRDIRRILNDYPRLDVIEREANPWDFEEILRLYRGIVAKEKSSGNQLFFNVSTGTKIAASAGLLTCMFHAGTPYYAKVARDKSNVTTGVRESVTNIITIPFVRIEPPPADEMSLLEVLDQAGTAQRKEEIIDKLVAKRVIPERESEGRPAQYMALKRIADRLEKKGYIEIVGERKEARVMLTTIGEHAAALLVRGAPKPSKTAAPPRKLPSRLG